MTTTTPHEPEHPDHPCPPGPSSPAAAAEAKLRQLARRRDQVLAEQRRSELEPVVAAIEGLTAEVRRGFEAVRPAELEPVEHIGRTYVTVLGPEVFVSSDGAVISWKGQNYTSTPDFGPKCVEHPAVDCPTPETHNWGCACTTVHAEPPDGSGLTPCCGRPPHEVQADRMTDDPAHVTCRPAQAVGALRDQIAEVLRTTPSAVYTEHTRGEPWERHGEGHDYLASCALCRWEADTLASAVLPVVEQHTAQLRRERDLALAHDRQPYPTADAYKQACNALERHRQRADRLEAELQPRQGRDGAAQLEPETESELREQLTAALLAKHQERAEQQIVAAPEEHCAALAEAALPIVRFALDAWHKAHQRANEAEQRTGDVLEEHDVHRKALARAVDMTLDRNWQQLIDGAARLHKAASDWKADTEAAWTRAEQAEQQLATLSEQAEQLVAEGRRLDERHAELKRQADTVAQDAERAATALASATPVLRRALEKLPEVCRYHGDQLDPDHLRQRYGSDACCDTGIAALRRRRALEALASLTTTKES